MKRGAWVDPGPSLRVPAKGRTVRRSAVAGAAITVLAATAFLLADPVRSDSDRPPKRPSSETASVPLSPAETPRATYILDPVGCVVDGEVVTFHGTIRNRRTVPADFVVTVAVRDETGSTLGASATVVSDVAPDDADALTVHIGLEPGRLGANAECTVVSVVER